LRGKFKTRIEELMQREQPFLQRGYTLRQLSEHLNIPQHHLSAVFREEFGANFNEFINRHRIAHVLQMLERQDQRQAYTLESIAADSGFNARNTFFLAFKKATGISPKEYLQQLQNAH
jgi:AraC-like DNA-binding protein